MKRFIAAAVIAAMLASFSGCAQTAEPENAEYIYGKIDSVSGNDIVLLLADYNEESGSEAADSTAESGETDDSSESKRSKGSGGKGFSKPENGERPEGFDPSNFGGERPERSSDSSDDSGSGEKKSRSKPENGEMPEGFDPSNFSGEMPEGFDPSKFGGERPERSSDSSDESGSGEKKSRSFGKQNSRYTLTGEQQELRIPVGVTVTTALGVKTDFDVLSAGDIIKCSIEKDSDSNTVVTEVWILEQ